MQRFDVIEPATLEEACGFVANSADAKVIAGGTALPTLIKHGVFVPKTFVKLKQHKDNIKKGSASLEKQSMVFLCALGALAREAFFKCFGSKVRT